jgi:glycosyltransferase involved in cell wall biosynthesis
MKIWFDHQIFSIQRYGGVSRYFVELLRGLRKIDAIEADIIAPAHVNAYLRADDCHFPISFSLAHPKRGMRYRPAITAPLFRLANLIGSPDIIHETHYALGSEHIPRRTRMVTTCHDMVFEKHQEWVSGSADRATLKRKTLDRADSIICISENTKNDLLDIYPALESKVSVIHHGTDHTPAPDTLDLVLPKPYLLFVGIRKTYKNFENLLKALGSSKQLRENFQLVCFGGGQFSAEEYQKSKSSGYPPERIHHLAGDDAMLAYLYKHAAAFVFPSLYEGFGMPLTEAMVQGCPIACSDASCFPEICGDAAVYFNGNDIDSMSNAIERLVDSPRQQSSYISKSRSSIFSWERCAQETFSVYKSII